MTPIFVWIHSGEIVGIGNTRREAFEDAQDAVEKTVSLFAAEGVTIDVPDIHTGGYGVRIRLSHYPEDADPRSVIALALKPVDDSDETELDLGIVEEILGVNEESEDNGEDWEALGGIADDADISDPKEYDKPNDTDEPDKEESNDTSEARSEQSEPSSAGGLAPPLTE